MSTSSIRVEIAPSWRRAVRGAVYDALFTGYRGYWLVRLGVALLLGAAGHASFGQIATSTDVGAVGLASVLVALPLAWFVYPILRGHADVGSALTILDEGVTMNAEHSSISVAWDAVRAVRRTLWDLVIVLDGACITVPLAGLTPGTVDSVLDRFRRGREAPRPVRVVEHVPYRTADERPPGPEDEEATPPEWRAPVPYRFSALAFPSRGQYVLALLSLKRSSLTWPGILLAGGTFMLVLGSAVSCNQSSMVTPLTLVGAVMAALGLGLLALAFSPALFALRERFVRERSAGVLYAVGPSGLYIRTHSFERREKWPAISALVVSRKRVAVCSAGLIHVIPLSAFATDQDRKSFTRAIETEIAKFLPSASR